MTLLWHNSVVVILESCVAIRLTNQTAVQGYGIDQLAIQALTWLAQAPPYKSQFTIDVRDSRFSLLHLALWLIKFFKLIFMVLPFSISSNLQIWIVKYCSIEFKIWFEYLIFILPLNDLCISKSIFTMLIEVEQNWDVFNPKNFPQKFCSLFIYFRRKNARAVVVNRKSTTVALSERKKLPRKCHWAKGNWSCLTHV